MASEKLLKLLKSDENCDWLTTKNDQTTIALLK